MSAPKQFHRWKPYEDAMLRKYAARLDAADIARRFKRSRKAVYVRAHLLGIKLRKRGDLFAGTRHSDDTVRAALRRWLAGEKPSDLARGLGVPKGTLDTWLCGSARPHLYREVMAE